MNLPRPGYQKAAKIVASVPVRVTQLPTFNPVTRHSIAAGGLRITVFDRINERVRRLEATARKLYNDDQQLREVRQMTQEAYPGAFPNDTVNVFFPGASRRLSYPLEYTNGTGNFLAIGIPLLALIATRARTNRADWRRP